MSVPFSLRVTRPPAGGAVDDGLAALLLDVSDELGYPLGGCGFEPVSISQAFEGTLGVDGSHLPGSSRWTPAGSGEVAHVSDTTIDISSREYDHGHGQTVGDVLFLDEVANKSMVCKTGHIILLLAITVALFALSGCDKMHLTLPWDVQTVDPFNGKLDVSGIPALDASVSLVIYLQPPFTGNNSIAYLEASPEVNFEKANSNNCSLAFGIILKDQPVTLMVPMQVKNNGTWGITAYLSSDDASHHRTWSTIYYLYGKTDNQSGQVLKERPKGIVTSPEQPAQATTGGGIPPCLGA